MSPLCHPTYPACLRRPTRHRFRQASLAGLLSLCLSCGHALELNQATEAELDNLSGFGPAFTARVMQARADRPFHSWGDFMRRVKGVREATALRLSQQGARIQQAPYTSPATRSSRD